MVGLGQTEAADLLAADQAGQILRSLRIAAVSVDRIDDQRRLHAQRRAVPGINPFDLAIDQPVGDIRSPCPAVGLGHRRAEQAQRANLGQDLAVEALLAEGGENARRELPLRVVARSVADESLLLGEQIVEAEGIGPVEGRACHDFRSLVDPAARRILRADPPRQHREIEDAENERRQRHPESERQRRHFDRDDQIIGVGARSGRARAERQARRRA